MTQVSVDVPVLLVTGDIQDSQDHQANQELVVSVQVIYTDSIETFLRPTAGLLMGLF